MSIAGGATRRELRVGGAVFDYYSLAAAEALGLAGVSRLPCSLKVVLENVLRQHAEGRSDGADIAAVAAWLESRRAKREIAFRFTRVLMPDSSGVPLLGDLAAMRDAMIRLGGDPLRLNPSVPVDLVVDHSVMVDAWQLGFPTTVVSDLTVAHAWGSHSVEENQQWSLQFIAAMAKSRIATSDELMR